MERKDPIKNLRGLIRHEKSLYFGPSLSYRDLVHPFSILLLLYRKMIYLHPANICHIRHIQASDSVFLYSLVTRALNFDRRALLSFIFPITRRGEEGSCRRFDKCSLRSENLSSPGKGEGTAVGGQEIQINFIYIRTGQGKNDDLKTIVANE